ncbi:YcfL family protein [Rariglobus hedericola]|uniref:DUF1425 domain-containing protein n=1 Tax=Rariglobus hedericola TaxID=2597822 RepID=A0A556QIW0_9BACT|nr:YcfL family protein [Rariglobus hedericola]TSJ76583.1 DUF1425 domain-containing protein [Rariglobus hedericola]
MKTSPRLLVGSLLVAGALVALSGCATNVNSVERAQPVATPNYISDKRVVTDNTLARTVRVNSVNQDTVSGNLLKVQATLENLKNNPRTVRYKFEWVSDTGMSIGSPNESWKTITILGRETTTISTVAVNPRAVDFVLKLSE